MARAKKEDPRDAELRQLRARVALLEGERHDLHELVRFFGNQNDVLRNFINAWIERTARRDPSFNLEVALEALKAIPAPQAEALIQGHSLLRDRTQLAYAGAGRQPLTIESKP
jgi:hypothetical protein